MRAVSKLCMAERTHNNIVSVFDYGRLSPFRYFIDMEICDFNLESWIYGNWNPLKWKTFHRIPRESSLLEYESDKYGMSWKISPERWHSFILRKKSIGT